jgi:hypothetical protein
MQLSHLTDKTLLLETKNLVTSEREATARVLHHLKEIDRRKLFSEMKFTSLFDYCVRELGYSEASAYRRIVAARLLAEIPEIDEKIETGALTLTNISQMNHFFKESTPSQKRSVLRKIEGLSKKECEKKLFELSGKEEILRETQVRVSSDKVKVAIVLSDETMNELEKLKALLGKDLSMDELVHFMAKEAIKSIEKDKFKQVKRPQKGLPPAEVGRVLPAALKRKIYQRDKKCTNCGSIHRLNFDHRIPYALGGPTNQENLRLLCFHCNQRARMRAGLGIKKAPLSRGP